MPAFILCFCPNVANQKMWKRRVPEKHQSWSDQSLFISNILDKQYGVVILVFYNATKGIATPMHLPTPPQPTSSPPTHLPILTLLVGVGRGRRFGWIVFSPWRDCWKVPRSVTKCRPMQVERTSTRSSYRLNVARFVAYFESQRASVYIVRCPPVSRSKQIW